MGARTVIGIDLLADPVGPGEPRNVLEIWQRVLCLMIRAAQPEPDHTDVLIHPDLAGFYSMDFDVVDAAYERGLRAAKEALPRIRGRLGRG